jgi:hypothetical protein
MIELRHLPHDGGKHSTRLPFLKTVMQGGAAHAEPVSVHGFPLAACPQHIPNPIECGSVIGSLASALARLIHLRYQSPNPPPQRARHMKIVDILGFCVTILAQGASVLMLSWSTRSERDAPSFSTPISIYG